MILFRVVYRIKTDPSQDWTADIVASSPEEILEELTKQFGELPYFRVINRTDIHSMMPSIEKFAYLKWKREHIDNE